MIFHETPVSGAFTIDLEKRGDERGFFARMFCTDEFEQHGLHSRFVQTNNSLSAQKGTLRGLHFQLPPHEEVKLVRCVRGSLWDLVLDVREGSPTHGKWYGATLTAENRTMMYVPAGCAHAFLTLEDDTEAIYMVSTSYAPEAERGIRFDDPAFDIAWPIRPVVVSDKDRAHPDWS